MSILNLLDHTFYSIRDVILPKRKKNKYMYVILSVNWIIRSPNAGMIIKSDSEKFVDTKEVIRSRNSKDRQYSGQKKRDKMTNNDLQNKNINNDGNRENDIFYC
jgi:hypothetical protein